MRDWYFAVGPEGLVLIRVDTWSQSGANAGEGERLMPQRCPENWWRYLKYRVLAGGIGGGRDGEAADAPC